MSTLGVDLGGTTGWAWRPTEGVIASGTWDMTPRKGEHPGERYRLFEYHLFEMYRAAAFTVVFYEDVKAHKGTLAAHAYGGRKAILLSFCAVRQIPCHGIGVTQVKKLWTGHGNANKATMIAEAEARGYAPIDDNEADALAVLHYGIINGDEFLPKPAKRRVSRKRSGGRRTAGDSSGTTSTQPTAERSHDLAAINAELADIVFTMRSPQDYEEFETA